VPFWLQRQKSLQYSKSIHGRMVAVNRTKKLLQLGRRRLQRCELANEFVHRPSLPVSDVLILAPSNGRAPEPARL